MIPIIAVPMTSVNKAELFTSSSSKFEKKKKFASKRRSALIVNHTMT